MLTPKKVFVDTIKTVQSLLSSGVSAEPDGVQNSPPRAKHILVPCYYPEKRLHAVHFPGKDIIVFEGSVIGFKQGHSVFGSCDVLSLVLEGFEKAHNNHAFRFTLEDKERVKKGDGLELHRLDVGVNFAVPDGVSVSRTLVELAHEMIDKGMNTSTYGIGETVYRKAYKRQVAYFATIGFDITTPPPVSGEEIPLGDIFTLSNAVEPPPELWGDDDDAEAVEC